MANVEKVMYVCDHGQKFDNGSRWCANCEKTVAVGNHVSGVFGGYSNKICPECSAVWPEYVDDFLADFGDDANMQHLFGVDATWH
jgi:hypothetical protein